MIAGRAQNPSPLAGEGAERTHRVSEAGEGWGGSARAPHAEWSDPSPGRSPRSSRGSRPPSPARGEGVSGLLARSSSPQRPARREGAGRTPAHSFFLARREER